MKKSNSILPGFYTLFFLFFFNFNSIAQIPWEEGKSRGEDLTIKLVTFGPGDAITTFFGHTAIIVLDVRLNISRIYNFGLFSIEKGFLVNFAQGRLIFWAGDGRVGPTLLRYAREDRDIFVQTLDLPPAKKLAMAQKLSWWVQPGNNSYLYHHYLNNCATIPRDILNEAVDGQFALATMVPSSMTYRDFTKRYTAHNPSLLFLLMYLMNDSIDQPINEWDDMFLPMELKYKAGKLSIADSTGNTHQLVTSEMHHYKADRKPVPGTVPSFVFPALIIGLLTGAVAIALGWLLCKGHTYAKILFALYNIAVGLVLGIPGLALLLMSLFTDHLVTFYNENILLANPVTFLAGILGIVWIFQKKLYSRLLFWSWSLLAIGSIILVMLKIFPAFDQNNLLIIVLILPVNLGFWFSHYRLVQKFRVGEDAVKS